jgi:hypothetical protein
MYLAKRFVMKFDTDDFPIYNFIANGLVSIPELAEGRFIPSIIIDEEIASDVDALCKAHLNSEPGDVVTTWISPITVFKIKELILKLEFKKPIELTFGIVFSLRNDYPIIDAINNSQALRIETGKLGDKVSQLKNADILIEVQRTDFSDKWEKYLLDIVKDTFRKQGVGKKMLENVAKQHVKTMRETFSFRST